MNPLLQRMQRVTAYDFADAPAQQGTALGKLNAAAFTPDSVAQIQLLITKNYYSENAGVYTGVLPSALPAGLKTDLPVFVFNNIDWTAGFAKSIGQLPPGGTWAFGVPFAYGADIAQSAFSQLDATATAQLERGDLVFTFTAVSGGTNYVCVMYIRLSDSSYTSLLDALNSNMFNMSLIRYRVPDDTAVSLAQFNKKILPSNLSMFGKYVTDNINPSASINPEQQQKNIVDIPYNVTITKQTGLSTYIAFDVPTLTWNIFIDSVALVK